MQSLKPSKRMGARGPRKPKQDAGTPLLDLAAATKARDDAMERILANAGTAFLKRGLRAIAEMSPHIDVTGEIIRVRLSAKDIRPHDAHAWGALTLMAVKHGLLVKTGRYTKMTDVSSHGRETQIYKVMKL